MISNGHLSIASSKAALRRVLLSFKTHLTISLATEVGWVIAGQLGALAASALSIKVLASQLGREEYGRLALGMTVPVLLNQFLYGPLTLAAMRYYSAYCEAGLLRSMLEVVYRYVRPLTGRLCLIGVVVSLFIGRVEEPAWGWIFFASLIFGLLQSLQGFFNSMQVAARRRVSAAIHQALDPLSRFIFGGAAVLLFASSAQVAVAGLAIGMAFILLSQYHWFQRSLPPGQDVRPDQFRAIRKTLWDYGKFVTLFGLFTWGQLASDRWALKLFHSDSAVGVYFAAFQLASIPGLILAGALAQFISPIVFQRAGDASNRERMVSSLKGIRLGVIAMVGWIFLCTLLATWLGEPILLLLTSDAYRAGAPYVPFVVLGLGVMQIGHILALVPLTYNNIRTYSVIKIAHSLIAVGLNVVGAWLYGIMGVCISLVVGGMLYVTMVVWNNVRILRRITDVTGLPLVAYGSSFPGSQL